ncbi:class I SAM-dependent DNA methyltransferase [Roseinatronobacter sp. S2]|uniref:class I SAM-dependent DNA methyltransferase n=1 Tax=Roseinatronobacter sp. S2 TaxID=3035471 RepID=UPI0027958391|nr:class I SAM-dependent DNA methyltransferase [Roseinatronobacter sp. S2]
MLDWSEIDPSILGTLFERGLDPDKRSQLGAHYTDRDKIMQIVGPVIVDPLMAEWAEAKGRIEAALDRARKAKAKATATKAETEARAIFSGFLDRLVAFRVLDPACGSGNFLYLALLALKDIEHRVNLEAEALGLQRELPRVGPEAVRGIELNPYAAELARVSVWIGEIQWMRRNGFEAAKNPILRKLGSIQNRDALLNPDGTRADWPAVDVVVGNPPFLGGKKTLSELGADYMKSLRTAYSGRLPNFSDLVCYWFAQAWDQMQDGRLDRAGFVATNSIRSGANREALRPIIEKGRIFQGWSDESWTVDGAAVRVSMICFDKFLGGSAVLDGRKVNRIFSDLTAASSDFTQSAPLAENKSCAFIGVQKSGPFDVSGDLARAWLMSPVNPNSRSNSDILRPYLNGASIVRRPQDIWIIDFGSDRSEAECSLYELPFQYAKEHIFPNRMQNNEKLARELWWQHWRPRPELTLASKTLSRIILTPRVAKHRIFVWRESAVVPDSRLIAIARDDDCCFGILSSNLHERWTMATCSWHGVGNDPTYNAKSCFETFPFPEGLTPNIPAADYADDPRAQKIAAAARLNELRENWLNPADLVERVPEVVPGYPDRILPKDEAAAKELKKRTLTNLYNARPAWLDHAHRALDEAVAEAYGWGDDWRAGKLTDDEILARLFRLNQERAGKVVEA